MFLIFQTLERNILSEGKMIGVGWAAGADDQQQQRRENVIRDNLQRRKCDQTEEKSEFLGEMSRMGLRGSDWSDVDYQWWLRWVSIRWSLWSENTEKILKNYDRSGQRSKVIKILKHGEEEEQGAGDELDSNWKLKQAQLGKKPSLERYQPGKISSWQDMGVKMLIFVLTTLLATSNAFNTICPSACTCKWKNGKFISFCICFHILIFISFHICILQIWKHGVIWEVLFLEGSKFMTSVYVSIYHIKYIKFNKWFGKSLVVFGGIPEIYIFALCKDIKRFARTHHQVRQPWLLTRSVKLVEDICILNKIIVILRLFELRKIYWTFRRSYIFKSCLEGVWTNQIPRPIVPDFWRQLQACICCSFLFAEENINLQSRCMFSWHLVKHKKYKVFIIWSNPTPYPPRQPWLLKATCIFKSDLMSIPHFCISRPLPGQ